MYRRRRVPRRTTRRLVTKSTMRWIVIFFIILVAAVIYLVSRPTTVAPVAPVATAPATLPAEISVEEAYLKYQQGVFFLDVRTAEEWDQVRIPNTTLIPLDELASRLDELPRDREIVVVCRSGNRSAQARDTLLAAGFPSVTSMAGGITQWSALNYPLEGQRP